MGRAEDSGAAGVVQKVLKQARAWGFVTVSAVSPSNQWAIMPIGRFNGIMMPNFLRPALCRIAFLRAAGLAFLSAVLLAACSTTHYRESADKEAYKILEQKSPEVPGMLKDIKIDRGPAPDLSALATIQAQYEFLGPEVDESGSSVLGLEKALELAFTHNRDYLSQKEKLYLQALSLTLDRHEFAPIFSGEISADHVWSAHDETTALARAVDTMAGAPAQLLQQYSDAVSSSGVMASRGTASGTDSVRDTSIEGSTRFGFNMLLKSGGRIATTLTTNFFQFLTGGSGGSASSTLAATFTQPLLRGAGKAVTTEFLTQGERDVLYALRDFTDFRKDFAVRVASQYYGALQARDAARNNYLGLKSFETSLKRERAFQEEGLKTAADVARLEESALRRELSWTNSVRNYSQSMDSFKILLGLPTDTKLVLDEAELTRLLERGVTMPSVTTEEAVQVALTTRLDLYTQKDQLVDAERRVKVAANALKPGLDLTATGNVGSKSGNRFSALDFDRSTWTAGLALDLPLDRKAERNGYRRSLIDYEVATRNASLVEDTVKLDVRNSYRNLMQAERDYEISKKSLDLNQSRADELKLRAELGLGNIIDQVDAQNALTAAQSGVTSAIVDYHISLLQFWRDLGILYVKENGMWEEIKDV